MHASALVDDFGHDQHGSAQEAQVILEHGLDLGNLLDQMLHVEVESYIFEAIKQTWLHQRLLLVR